ncbi:MAG: SPFH/Band 7/PHB domain protein [Lentisphaeria bacterium]|nr:SPFH/Band 7/PHB domain protein [Lentisphaeria bacterium]
MSLIYTVPQAHCVILERLGKFSKIVSPGLQFRLPFIEKQKNVIRDCGWSINGAPVACKIVGNFTVIELSDQRLDTKPRDYHTADNVPVRIDAVIFWRIVDPEKAVYAVDRLIDSMIDQALNSMRSCIGASKLDDLLTNREFLNSQITEKVAAVAQRWGIVIQRVEIQELVTDDATTNAMRAEMAAEREKRAAVIAAEAKSKATIAAAEAERESMIIKAEAEKRAMIIKAEAEKESAIMVAEGAFRAKELGAEADALYVEKICAAGKISPEKIVSILIANKYVDGFNAISKNPADKVFLPNSFGNMNLFVDSNKE